MDLYNLDKSIDDLLRSVDESVNGLLKGTDNIIGGSADNFQEVKMTETHTGNELQNLPRLVRDERLEDRTMSRIGTFEKIYREIYESQTKRLMSFGYSDLEYSVLVTLLSSCIEIELNQSVYRKIQQICKDAPAKGKCLYDTNINIELKTQTLGCFTYLINRFGKELTEYIGNSDDFESLLSKVISYRNKASHTSVISKEQFLNFYMIFSKLFNENITGLMDLKSSLRGSSYSFSTINPVRFDKEELEYLKRISRPEDNNVLMNDDNSGVHNTVEFSCSDASDNSNSSSNEKGQKYGVIFTDCKQLAVKYKGNSITKEPELQLSIISDIRRKILEYINECLRFGIHYVLLDVSLFDPFFDKSDGWRAYLNILDRFCDKNGINPKDEPWGLFIIGGNDVIPMPLVYNPVYAIYEGSANSDNSASEDVDSDLFYSFKPDQILLDEKLKVDLNRLFNCNPRFFVGRLPLENGFMETSFDNDIGGYFARSINAFKQGGIKIGSLPLVTSCESSKTVARFMTMNIPIKEVTPMLGYIENNIIISPPYMVDEKLISSNQEALYCLRNQMSADMLVFILHGSDEPTSDEYLGESGSKDYYTVGFSADMFAASKAKCVAGICCFGARFIGYRRKYSALLQAIYNNTLLFMGSSRLAYGYFDCHLGLKNKKHPIYASEVLMRYYLAYLLSGFSAAESLLRAKVSYIDYAYRNKDAESSIPMGLTLMEFNLYGDPFQSLVPLMDDYHVPDLIIRKSESERTEYKVSDGVMSYNGLRVEGNIDCLSEKRNYSTLYDKKDDSSNGLGRELRNMVDNNFRMIHDVFAEKLYDILGVPPRDLYCIKKYSSSVGTEGYTLLYKHTHEKLNQETIVELDKQGNINSVLSSF